MLEIDPERSFDWDFCDSRACMEVRACQVADCAGKAGKDLRDCVEKCARWSIKDSAHCKIETESLLKKAMQDCFSGDDELGPFPF